MLATATGMKPGERYRVEALERAHQFPGFFLDGKYFLGPELLTAIGWLEGQSFIYDNLDATGEPVFADRIAGDIADLKLTLVDGTVLELVSIEDWAHEPISDQAEPSAPVQADWRSASLRGKRQPSAPWLMIAAVTILGGCALALLRGKGH